jgi:DNA (cytosine-5)-methyltransferase 1
LKIGLVYGGCGSAAVAARNLGHEIVYNYEPRGLHFLDTFILNFGNIKSNIRVSMACINPLPEGSMYGADIIIGQPDCKIYSALRTRKKEDVSIGDTQLYGFFEVVLLHEPKAFIVENLPKGIDAMMDYINVKAFYDMKLNSGITLHGGPKVKLFDYDITRVDINAKDYLPQSRLRSFIVGTPKYSTKNFEFLSASPDFLLNSSRKLIKDLEDEESYEIFKNHKAAKHSEERIKGFSKLGPGVSYYGTQNNRRLDPNKPAYTITSHCTQHVHYKLDRTLTVRECARFMGFPDTFEFVGPTTKQMDQVGKAIVVPVIQDLLGQLVKFLEGKYKYSKSALIFEDEYYNKPIPRKDE